VMEADNIIRISFITASVDCWTGFQSFSLLWILFWLKCVQLSCFQFDIFTSVSSENKGAI
jgi:hypothetical protein